MDRREREIACETASRRACVDPGEFKGSQGEREVFRAGDVAAFFRFHEKGSDAGFVKGLEKIVFAFCPFMRIPAPVGHEPRDRPAGNATCRLNHHLEVVALRKTPHDLANVIPGESFEVHVVVHSNSLRDGRPILASRRGL